MAVVVCLLGRLLDNRRLNGAGLQPNPLGPEPHTQAFTPTGEIGSRDVGLHRLMTASDTATPDLGRFGFFGLGATREQAQEIERLGYGTIWVGGSPPAEL